MTSVSVISDDLIEELVEENRRQFKELLFADKCLDVMTEFKSFIDFISIQFINHLESEVWKKFEQLSAKVDNICDIKKLVVNNGVLSKELLKSVIQETSKLLQNNPNKDILLKQLLVDNSTGDERQLHSQTKPNSSTNGSNKSLISKVSHNSGKFKCPKKNCQKAFPSRNLLSRHYYNCHSEKRFVCQFPECSYKTSMKWNFKKHSATHITKSGHYKCRYFRCERVYKNLEDVVKHMKVVHQSAGMTTTVKANIAKPVTSMKSAHSVENNSKKDIVSGLAGCRSSRNTREFIIYDRSNKAESFLSNYWSVMKRNFTSNQSSRLPLLVPISQLSRKMVTNREISSVVTINVQCTLIASNL